MTQNQKRDANDIFAMPILKFLFKNRYFLLALKLLVLGLFFYAILLGFIKQDTQENTFTTMLFWTLFWPFFVIVTLSTFGRVFCGICPHGFLGKYISKFGLKKQMPKFLANPFLGLLLLFFGIWVVYYINPLAYKTPLATAIVFSLLSLYAFVSFFLFKDMSYCKSLCPVGTLMRVYSKVSFTWLGTYDVTCKECKSFACANACPYTLKPYSFNNKHSMEDCTLCMECANACEGVSFKLVKPSFSLFEKFKSRKVEIWGVLLITAAITITMNFHHALSRVAISDTYPWVKFGAFLQTLIGVSGVDYVGLSALLFALISTLFFAIVGTFMASKFLHVEFSKSFYTLSYAFIPIFIIGGLSHAYEFFFIHYFHDILNGFINGFGLNTEKVMPLATRKDGWVHIFSLMNYIAIVWGLFIMYKRVGFFQASKLAKLGAFLSASLLILFYLYLNIYKTYAFATYGVKKGGHHHGSTTQMFQSVPFSKATLLQEGKDKGSCPVCGMKLPLFYKTNHAAIHEYKNRQYCSIHCLAQDLHVKHLELSEIRVVDTDSLRFIDAKSAFYVIGSKKPATMSLVSKYAFENEAEAKEFVKLYGGKITDFKEALSLALKDFK